MPHSRPQILKLAARRCDSAPGLHVLCAGLLVQVGELFIAEIVEDALQPCGRFLRPSMLAHHILGIDGDYVRDGDGRWVTVADSLGGFGVEVVSESSFSLFNFARAASSAPFD